MGMKIDLNRTKNNGESHKKLNACRIFLAMDNSNNNVIGCLNKLNNNVNCAWLL